MSNLEDNHDRPLFVGIVTRDFKPNDVLRAKLDNEKIYI